MIHAFLLEVLVIVLAFIRLYTGQTCRHATHPPPSPSHPLLSVCVVCYQGPHYWLSKYHAPPPDPLNPVSLLKPQGLLKQTPGLRKAAKKSDKDTPSQALAPDSEEEGADRETEGQRQEEPLGD